MVRSPGLSPTRSCARNGSATFPVLRFVTSPFRAQVLLCVAVLWLYVDYTRTKRKLRLPSTRLAALGEKGFDPIPRLPDPRRRAASSSSRVGSAVARACRRRSSAPSASDQQLAEHSALADFVGARDLYACDLYHGGGGPVADAEPKPRARLERMASILAGGGVIRREGSRDNFGSGRFTHGSGRINLSRAVDRSNNSPSRGTTSYAPNPKRWSAGQPNFTSTTTSSSRGDAGPPRIPSRSDMMSYMATSLGIPSSADFFHGSPSTTTTRRVGFARE